MLAAGNECEKLQVWSCNSTWQRGARLFVCLAASPFLWATGTRELLECGCVSVLGWALSLICSFNLRAALQQREANFSPPSSLLLSASYDVVPPPGSVWVLVKGEAAERGGPSGPGLAQAHSGHCVRARNNIYRSPLWAPWKQSQY